MNATAEMFISSARDLPRRASDFSHVAPSHDTLVEGYAKLNLPPGSAILLSAPNTVEFLLHWIAVLQNGLVPAAIAPSAKQSFVESACSSLRIAAISGQNSMQFGAGKRESAMIGSFRTTVLQRDLAPYDPFDVLVLTTGTSGSQSACVHRLDSLIRNAAMTNRTLGITASDKQLVVLPLYHSFGLITQSIGAIISGGELLIDGPPFNAERFASLIRHAGISVCGVTPTIARDLIMRKTGLESLRSLSVGGDQMSAPDVQSLLDDLHVKELYITYGLTEAGPRISVLPAHCSPRETFDSVGKVFPEIQAKIDRPDSEGVGQLLVKTPSALRRKVGVDSIDQPFDDEGFLLTGDLFTKDDAGYLRFVARSREIVVVSGEKVNTRYVTQVIEQEPSVAFARTRLSEDGNLVSLLWAREGRELDLQVIHRALRKTLRSHEIPILREQTTKIFHK
ncbi:class I adenylate-forming enzyme family protein [Agrobacterium tumefaciens]|uniref:class I adenylate-forming enzyme family protein n=1 Tax=Agrobacterium tumefaciens TaxID=358 RepID=UPI0022438524|nr:class I adenylate-forming enzyme family protein [Agrobacterium tumefaciens]MCW8060097.1 acyl--CoA ligase [Agrobacterium tumefaciens]